MDVRKRLILSLERDFPADDVMDANARTARAFSASEVGHFERIGANSWDPSRFVLEANALSPMRIFPGVKIHVEPALGWFRMRYRGQVTMFEWQPEAAGDGDPHAAFLTGCVAGYRETAGIGAAAFIAKTLDQ